MTGATIIHCLFPLLVIAAAYLFACEKHFERPLRLMLLVAIGLYYFQFYHSGVEQFTLDAQTHIDYIVHIATHGRIPEPEDNIVAARHPPTYYAIAAGFYRLGQYMGAPAPILIARQFSMICYVAFILISIQLIRLVLPPGGGYYAAMALVLFWPIGVTVGARITCDPLLFAGEAATLYCLARWFKDRQVGNLACAFLCCALSIAAKNGGVLLGYLSLGVLACALFEYRRSPRIFLRFDLIASMLFAFVVYKITLHHGWVTQHTAADTGHYNWPDWWRHVSHFDLFLLMYETSMGLSHDMFWNMWLHTLLLGDDTMPWQNPDILICFQIVWIAIILYLLAGLFKMGHLLRWEKQMFLMLLASQGAMIAAMLYMLLCTGNPGYSDARYAYPCVAGISLWFGKTMELYRGSGPASLYRVGVGLAGLFAALTFALFLCQYSGLAL